MGNDHTINDQTRTTVAEAARILDISAEAVRGRIRRGTLHVEREDGRVYVLLERAAEYRTNDDQTRTTEDRRGDRTELLIAELQDRIRALEEANSENRRIVAALTSRIPAIEAPSDAPESPETGEYELDREDWIEGNKLAAEAAKALVIVGSGLLVGMAAVVGVMPDASASSPLLFISFVFVLISIFSGILWMREIALVTMWAEGNAMGRSGFLAVISFMSGMAAFVLYVLWNSPSPPGHPNSFIDRFLNPDAPREQVRYYIAMFVLAGLIVLVTYFVGWLRDRRRSSEPQSPPSQSA